MATKKIEYLSPLNAIEVHQGDYIFYVFKISAKKLLSVSYTSERTKENKTGIQRGLRRDRLISIGRYLQGKTSGQPVLPNCIIVSLSNESYYKDGKLLIANREAGEAFVIDGQHRLWSFQNEFSDGADLEIVVSAFIQLPDEKKALIFKTINGEQRKINPSLVYDLIPMLRNKEWVQFEEYRSQEIVTMLNEDKRSPWANRISMVGEPGKIISQSSFITAIKKLFKKGHLFSDEYLEAVIQEDLLIQYFNSISDQYSIEWDNKDYFLCKYIGVSAVLNLFELIIRDTTKNGKSLIDDRGVLDISSDLKPYIDKLRKYDFSTKDAKSMGLTYVGEAGVNDLFKKISLIVFPTV